MIFGTYSAQRAADDGLVPQPAAHRRRIQGFEGCAFLQVTGSYQQIRTVGRVGLEPTTGGL